MTVMTITVPVYSKKEIFVYKPELSTGTNYKYIYRNDEFIQVRKDQLWFWTDDWQALEAEADNDISTGNFEIFNNMDDFIAALDE